MPDENKSHFVDAGTTQKPWWPRFQSLLKLLLSTKGVVLSKSTQCLGAVVPLAKFFSSVLQFLPIHSRTKYVSMHFTPWLYLHSPYLPMMHLQCVHPHFQPVASGCCRHQRPRWKANLYAHQIWTEVGYSFCSTNMKQSSNRSWPETCCTEENELSNWDIWVLSL